MLLMIAAWTLMHANSIRTNKANVAGDPTTSDQPTGGSFENEVLASAALFSDTWITASPEAMSATCA
ncbi:hypothetical protein D9M69_82130 [compost metagenome]